MKTFYVLWTYIANYSSLMVVEGAKDAEEAVERMCGFYNANQKFREKATVMVFDTPPVFLQYKGAQVSLEDYRRAVRETREE